MANICLIGLPFIEVRAQEKIVGCDRWLGDHLTLMSDVSQLIDVLEILFNDVLRDLGVLHVTDVQEPLPPVLSHDAWLALRQAEQRRESDRLELQQARKERRSELLVADDGRPSPTQPTEIQHATQAFVAACANRSRADQSRAS